IGLCDPLLPSCRTALTLLLVATLVISMTIMNVVCSILMFGQFLLYLINRSLIMGIFKPVVGSIYIDLFFIATIIIEVLDSYLYMLEHVDLCLIVGYLENICTSRVIVG
ncbi:hypothetical protein ACJX0J_010928, partial [Zea mays]